MVEYTCDFVVDRMATLATQQTVSDWTPGVEQSKKNANATTSMCHSVRPHSDKPLSLEPRPLSRIPSGRIPLGRIPISRCP